MTESNLGCCACDARAFTEDPRHRLQEAQTLEVCHHVWEQGGITRARDRSGQEQIPAGVGDPGAGGGKARIGGVAGDGGVDAGVGGESGAGGGAGGNDGAGCEGGMYGCAGGSGGEAAGAGPAYRMYNCADLLKPASLVTLSLTGACADEHVLYSLSRRAGPAPHHGRTSSTW